MADNNYERRSIFGGFIWKFLERITSQGITFLITIILARLLMPEQYGVIAMVNVFIALANVLIHSGLNTALIQKKKADDLDFSTILYCNIVLSSLLYALLYVSAPYIESFYNMVGLAKVTRVYGLTLILGAYSSIQLAYVSRNMIFRKTFYASTVATVLSGLIGIWLAYHDFGVWALVAQYLLATFFSIIMLSFIIDWHPKLMFSWNRASQLMQYGVKVMSAAFIGEVFIELRQLLIGKFYSAADLAQYNRGKTFPALISSNIETTIGTVLFPAMSNHGENVQEVKQMTRRSMKTSSFLMFFLFSLLAVIAHPLVQLLLTDKWLDCVPYMQLMCVSGMVTIISTANMQAIKAIGRSDVVLKLELYKKPVFLILLVIAVKISVLAVAITLPLYAIYGTLVNMSPNKKLLNYSYREQLKDILPQLLLSILMAACVIPFGLIPLSPFIILVLQIIVGVSVYFFGAKVLKIDSLQYCKNTVFAVVRQKGNQNH